MLGVLNRPVFSLGPSSAGAASFGVSDVEWDYAIGGLPFMSAVNDQRPLLRQLVDIRKEQFDNSKDPGEQSLTGWWLRSQASWHAGAGLLYQEPSQDSLHSYRFASSAGVDPWTPGQLKLLRTSTKVIASSTTSLLRGASNGGTDYVLMADGTALKKWDGVSSGTITWGGTNTIVSLCDDGTNYYAADSVGIYKGTIPSGAGTKIWNTGTASVVCEWVKQRLVAGIGASIYELTTGGPTLPTAKYTHPNTSWTWTSIADTPTAILAAGYAGSTSAIYKFTLANDGTMPTLSQGVLVAELPRGELVNSISTYLGTFLAICTTKGIRIGIVDDQGGVQMGPLNVAVANGVKSATGRDRFIYFGYPAEIPASTGATSGLGRIDLSLQTSDGVYAYASDTFDPASAQTGAVPSVVNFGNSGRMAYSIDSYGLCVETASTYFSTGFVQGGKVRYDTLEPKIFKYLRLRTLPIPTGATIAAAMLDEAGVERSVISYTSGQQPNEDVLVSIVDTTQENMAVKVTLTSDGTAADQPTLVGWQLKSMPGAVRQVEMRVPVLCYDFETDRNGGREGYDGRAVERLSALESLARSSGTTTFQNLAAGTAELVVIEDVQFVQTASVMPRGEGTGGVIQILMRTVS